MQIEQLLRPEHTHYFFLNKLDDGTFYFYDIKERGLTRSFVETVGGHYYVGKILVVEDTADSSTIAFGPKDDLYQLTAMANILKSAATDTWQLLLQSAIVTQTI